MFSGIIEELGEVKSISRRGQFFLLEIKAVKIQEDIKIGDSIAVNGVCLTLTNNKDNFLAFEVMPQTAKITNLGVLRISEKVNLERALKIGDRLSGHFISGHIDEIGIIRNKNYVSGNLCFEVAVEQKFMQYILPRGSVAVDGISLTVVNKKSNTFFVHIIPHTLKNTTLSFKQASDKVNIEFDILAKAAKANSSSTRS